jgi:hypothetical protein
MMKRYNFLRINKARQTVLAIMLIILLVGFAGFVSSAEKKRVESILNSEPTRHAIATVIAVDLRSTRSGKQAWSIIQYKVNNQIIEQSFADSQGLVGERFEVQYSLGYPDMFRVLKKIN